MGEDDSNLTEADIVEQISQWDDNGDGKIDFNEFLGAMTRILTDTGNEDRLREAFSLFDKVKICAHVGGLFLLKSYDSFA